MSETQEYPTYEQSLKNYNEHIEDLQFKHSIRLEDKCRRNDFPGMIHKSVIDEMIQRQLINQDFYLEQKQYITLLYFDDDDYSQCDITCLVLQFLTTFIMMMCFIQHISKDIDISGSQTGDSSLYEL
tara:strand:- start:212 stop:592 length:381 start_codon:yes stop_codon:yes gene_type:complete